MPPGVSAGNQPIVITAGDQKSNAANMAVQLGSGKTPSGNQTVNGNVPAQIITPIVVNKSNVKDTVVKDGFWTVQGICTPQYAAACKSTGLG